MLAHLGTEPSADPSRETARNLATEYSIPHSCRHVYSNKQRLRSFVEEKYTQWEAEPRNNSQYISIHGAPPDIRDWIDQSYRNLPSARIQYSEAQRVMVWKLADWWHEKARTMAHDMFRHSCRAAGIVDDSLIGTGASRSHNQGRDKEPDNSYQPTNTRPGENDKPTMIMEIGHAESLGQLRTDAHHWLTHTNGAVRIVLLLHINRPARTLRMERWEMVPRCLPRPGPTHSPTMLQTIDLSVSQAGTATISGAPLLLPVDRLFDQRPAGIQADNVIISVESLERFILSYFR